MNETAEIPRVPEEPEEGPRTLEIPTKKSHKGLKIAAAVLGALVVVLMALNLVAGVNVQLLGSADVQLTNAAAYEEAGASATFHSPWGGNEQLDAASAVFTLGSVNHKKPGDYTLTYVGHYGVWLGWAQRQVHVRDTAAPVITLNHVPGAFTPLGEEYVEEGYSALDDYDGDVTANVQREVGVDQAIYTVTDSAGNTASVTRDIPHKDPLPPEVILQGDAHLTLQAGTAYEEPGYTATDLLDGDVTASVQVEGEPDIYRAGDYTITYSATDAAGNVGTATRMVTVEPIRQPDVVNPGSKVVYLTFDDGPNSSTTAQLLDMLARYNVKVTFFVTALGDTSMIAREAAEGHAIGMHSASHNYNKIYASESAFWADMNYINDIIAGQTGSRTTLMRFPGGSSNTVSSFNPGIMSRLVGSAGALGYQYFDWNVSSGDAGSTEDTDQVFENVTSGIAARDVSVVLQHDIKQFSVDAVEAIIVWGLSNGYTFLPLDSSSPTCHHGVNN